MALLTNEKIKVTTKMLEENNMTRFGEVGIPVDASAPSMGLIWKSEFDLTISDLDTLEEYFLKKQSETKQPTI